MTPDLHDLMQFKNDQVIGRYGKEYPHSKMKPYETWGELMKFIWLCHQHEQDKNGFPENPALQFECVMHSEMQDIDNMWHTFLLFTRDYQQFCQDYLNGVFFHHQPLEQKQTINDDLYAEELTHYLSYIFDKLGQNTLIKWFNS